MKLKDIEAFITRFRSSPLYSSLLLLFLVLVVALSSWWIGCFQERGRQYALSEQELTRLSSSLRFSYYRFEGSPAISRILAGKSFSPSAGFETTPFILKNRIFRDSAALLRNLMYPRDYRAYPFSLIELRALQDNGEIVYEDTIVDFSLKKDGVKFVPSQHKERQKNFDKFSATNIAARPPSLIGPIPRSDLIQKIRSDPFWVIDYEPKSGHPLFRYSYIGMPPFKDIQAEIKDPITRRIGLENRDSRDLALTHVHFQHGKYYGIIFIRELSLMTLNIENISSHTINIHEFSFREILEKSTVTIRTPSEVSADLLSADEKDFTSPLESLAPGEVLLIPLYLDFGLSVADEGTLNAEGVVQEFMFPTTQEWWTSGIGNVYIPMADDWSSDIRLSTSYVSFSKSLLKEKKNLRDNFTDFYRLGSTLDILSVGVSSPEGVIGRLPLRRFDPQNILVRGGNEVGSCPVLYVYIEDRWIRIGEILVNAVGEDLQQRESIVLPYRTQAVRVIEEEPEVSYIDCVLLETRQQVVELKIRGHNSSLTCEDGSYERIDQGEYLEFQIPEQFVDKLEATSQLVIRGFYIPH